MIVRINRMGYRYGRLVVIALHSVNNNRTYWQVKCDCGTNKTVLSGNLASGRTKSCGCLVKEGTARKHGMSRSNAYMSWASMKDRWKLRT